MVKHNTVYAVLLAVYGAMCLITGLYGFYHLEPSRGRNTGLLLFILQFLMALFILILRLGKSKYARIATRVVNIVYLPFPFLGTALGIYGLLKVDRKRSNEGDALGTTVNKAP
jgi:hypothetical protein